MKEILSFAGMLALAILFTSAISIDEVPQDPPRGNKAKKHIKMVTVDNNGAKTELDTIIETDEVFIWNGDTLGPAKELKEIFEGDFDFDFDFDMDVDEEEGMFIMKGKSKPMIFKFRTDDGDSAKQIAIKKFPDIDCDEIMKWPRTLAPHVVHIDKHRENIIDLSGPGIISFKKKDLKGGKEKIIIIREKPLDNESILHKEIIMHGEKGAPAIIHKRHPLKARQIKVIAGDKGKVEIYEDGELWSVDEMDEGTKVIEKDGKKIIIKKMKEGDNIKVDVEVEEEIEKEQDEE